jgi:preprotein translocase subunit SecE
MAGNPVKKLGDFFVGSKQELKKVNWPTFEELRDSTVVVVVSILMLALFIGAVDFVLSKVIEVVIR